MTQHVQTWTKGWPEWVPEPVRRYIAHTEGGTPIRSLARAEGCHASTVLRQIRQVESARDDLLIDEALTWLGEHAPTGDDDLRIADRLPGFAPDGDGPGKADLDRAAIPALRILSQPGALLIVSAEMDRAVVVRNGPDGEAHRLGVVERHVAQALALNRWIQCAQSGRLSSYRITTLGRTVFKTLIARAENRANGFAEAPGTFRAREAKGKPQAPRHRMGLTDTPVMALARRRDKSGDPFLPPALVRAAERIQDDYELAQMEPRQTTNWDDYLTAGTSGPGLPEDGPLRGAAAARARVSAALRVLGPGLGDVVLECCCRLQGMETAEKKLGWSARSGKIVLRIALQRLKQHYDGMNDGGGLIG